MHDAPPSSSSLTADFALVVEAAVDPRPPSPRAPHTLLSSSERRALGLSGLLLAAFSGDFEQFTKEVGRTAALARPEKAWARADNLGRGVLHGAAAAGHPAIIKHVLAAKMLDVDAPADGGVTALVYALDRKDVDGAAQLLAAGADPGQIERTYGRWDAAWATEVMGLFGTPRAEALALLKDALRQALAKGDIQHHPWLDVSTQLDLFQRWAGGLKAGTRVDACDCDEHWYEAVCIGTFPGGVRVSYLSWGPRFEEDILLNAMRVLPAYSVVPAWRETLTIGSPVEILATTAEAAAHPPPPPPPPGTPEPERKWWDATCRDIDRLRRMVLVAVDGRPHLSQWVSMDSREISDISTHVKHPPLHHHLVAVAPAAVGKESVPVTMRQAAAREAVKAGDLARLLSLIPVQEKETLTYVRRKLGLIAFHHSNRAGGGGWLCLAFCPSRAGHAGRAGAGQGGGGEGPHDDLRRDATGRVGACRDGAPGGFVCRLERVHVERKVGGWRCFIHPCII